jgi:hypothetical protein
VKPFAQGNTAGSNNIAALSRSSRGKWSIRSTGAGLCVYVFAPENVLTVSDEICQSAVSINDLKTAGALFRLGSLPISFRSVNREINYQANQESLCIMRVKHE